MFLETSACPHLVVESEPHSAGVRETTAHFPVEGVGLAAGTGCFMLREANTRFEWWLDLDGVGVGIGVVQHSKMQIVGKLLDMTISERDGYRNLECSPSIGGKRK
jgi:hypothetical protein